MRRHELDPRVYAAAGRVRQPGRRARWPCRPASVDIVLQDWLWVSRQRAAGAEWTCAPVPAALGAMMRPPGSPIGGMAELRGRRLGIAGGPLDKSWLLLRLYAHRQTASMDLDAAVEKIFGPPPLMAEQLRAGRLDAELTYWPFAARAEAAGLRPVLNDGRRAGRLDLPRDMPMLGFVFGRGLGGPQPAALQAFLAAMRKRVHPGAVGRRVGADCAADRCARRGGDGCGCATGIGRVSPAPGTTRSACGRQTVRRCSPKLAAPTWSDRPRHCAGDVLAGG